MPLDIFLEKKSKKGFKEKVQSLLTSYFSASKRVKVEESLPKESEKDILSQQRYLVKGNALVDPDDEIEIPDYIPGNLDCEMMSPIQKRKVISGSESMEAGRSYEGKRPQDLMFGSAKRSQVDIAIYPPVRTKQEESMSQVSMQEIGQFLYGKESQNMGIDNEPPRKKYYDACSEVEVAKTELIP